VNREQLLTAVYTALQAASSGNLKTKTLHSEVLLALHPSASVSLQGGPASAIVSLITNVLHRYQPQINEALRKFGVSQTTKNLILVRIGPPSSSASAKDNTPTEDEIVQHEQRLVDTMSELVNGEMTSLDHLGDSDLDWKGLKKVSNDYLTYPVEKRRSCKAEEAVSRPRDVAL
jgi:hypothetical protein